MPSDEEPRRSPRELQRLLRRRVRNYVWGKLRGVPHVEELVARGLQLGEDVAITHGVFLDPEHCHLISVGDRSTLGPGVIVLAHDASTKRHLDYTRIARVRIGSRVFIGARSVILPGVTIGDDVIVGAGSVVSRDVAAGAVVVGTPAREIMRTEEYVARHRDRLHVAPTYSRDGWSRIGHMAPGNAQRMAAELAETDGYVH